MTEIRLKWPPNLIFNRPDVESKILFSLPYFDPQCLEISKYYLSFAFQFPPLCKKGLDPWSPPYTEPEAD